MNKIFAAVVVSSMMISGASLAATHSGDGHGRAVTRSGGSGDAIETLDDGPTIQNDTWFGTSPATVAYHAPRDGWNIRVVESTAMSNRRKPNANGDTDRGAILRELAANPGLQTSLKHMNIWPNEIAALSVRGHHATVFMRS